MFSRVAGAITQLILAAVLARYLTVDDLGRFAVAFTVSAFAGTLVAPALRRAASHRLPKDSASDLKVLAILSSVPLIALAAAGTGAAFDSETALISAILTAWRGADAYAEIAQGTWTGEGNLRTAGKHMTLRQFASTTATIATLALAGFVGALMVGLVVRVMLAARETRIARPSAFHVPSPGVLRTAAATLLGVSATVMAIFLVDAVPSLLTAHQSGVTDAAVLAPLGRIRFGVALVATSLGEMTYARMLTDWRSHGRNFRATAGPILQVSVVTLFLGAILLAGGAQLAFGEVVDGAELEIAAAVGAGYAAGVVGIVALALLAQGKVRVQLLGFWLAAVMATAGAAAFGWSVSGMYLAQAIACSFALAFLFVFRDRWSSAREQSGSEANSRS